MKTETSTRVSDSVFTSVMAAEKLPPIVSSTLSKLLQLDDLDELYRKTIAAEDDGRLPFERLFHVLETEVKVSSADLQRIPTTGPVIVVANHPFGFVEGCAFAAILPKIRPDVKIMANSLISVFAGLSDRFLFVNPFGSAAASRENRKGVRAAIEYLRSGGCLVMFPAGEVAHLSLRERGIVEPAWNLSAAAFARITGASIVPAFFPGSNSKTFHAAGLIHPRLRTALLPREFINMTGRTIELRIGSGVTAETLSRFIDDYSATEYLQERTSLLRHRVTSDSARGTTSRVSCLPECVDPVPPAELSREVRSLGDDHVLVSMQDLTVFSAGADEIPAVLREIGRLREITFRRAGEGTARSIDLDRFDAYYEHLFVWNRTTNVRTLSGAPR